MSENTTRPGDVPFEIAGRRFILRLGWNALADLQREWEIKENAADFWKILQETRNPRAWRSTFWHALRTHQPDLTPEQAGLLMDALDITQLTTLMAAALAWTGGEPVWTQQIAAGRPS